VVPPAPQGDNRKHAVPRCQGRGSGPPPLRRGTTESTLSPLSKGGPTERSEVEGGFLVFPPLDQGWSDSMSRDKLSLKPASQMPIRQLDV